ncbi:MAG: hypothetical protein C0522_11445 [Rhodocyclaceae bacterium]|jgi:electron transport complex protein RnfG|nr:hypothetical protein [Rhodocyclaceae bacterium]
MNLDGLREKLPYQPTLLGAVALMAGAALAFANSATRGHIAAAEARDMQATLAQVLPRGFADNDLLADVIQVDTLKVHLAKKDGQVAGAVFQRVGRGYGGDIEVLMAVDACGTVLGVRVLKHRETPGLGDKIEAAKSPWIEGFAGKDLAQVRIPVFVVLIAGLVTVVDMALNAWLHDLYKVLGLFIALIVVNCAILGRAEAYAVKNGVLASAVDGLAMGLGFTFALTVIGLIRELLGFLLAGKRVWEARPTKASETEEADPTTA